MILAGTLQMQRDVTGVIRRPTPRRAIKTAIDMAHVMAEGPRRLIPQASSRLAWLEFQNKLEVFSLFEHVDLILDLLPPESMTLLQLTARASALDSYRSVWATEGIGHYYAQGRRATNDDHIQWPTARLAPLHAGMGLAFASEVLERVGAGSDSAQLRDELQGFFRLCHTHSHEGYTGAMYEALGLVARNLYPHLLLAIDAELAKLDQQLIGYFWHGVGRAIYFAPSNFLVTCSAARRAMEMALSEPPHELGKLNAVAGVVWALTLVNLRQPQILELFLRYHWSQMAAVDVVGKSLSAALLIWRDSSPTNSLIDKLSQYRPANSVSSGFWSAVRQACADASEPNYRVMKENNRLGSLFRYY